MQRLRPPLSEKGMYIKATKLLDACGTAGQAEDRAPCEVARTLHVSQLRHIHMSQANGPGPRPGHTSFSGTKSYHTRMTFIWQKKQSNPTATHPRNQQLLRTRGTGLRA